MMIDIFENIKGWICENNYCESFQNWRYVYWNSYWGDLAIWLLVFSILFLGLVCLFIYNERYKKLFKWISDHIGICSIIVWSLGVLVYIVGFYKQELTALAIVPRAIIASFRMFVVANELARIPNTFQQDALYMTAFSLVHFAAALITFLFIFKMLGYKIRTTVRLIWHSWWRSKNKNVHLFWGINDASCSLAKDKDINGDTIIMIDVDKEGENDSQKKTTISSITNIITIKDSEIALLDKIGALVDHCYNGPASVDTKSNNDVFGQLRLNTVRKILQKSKSLNIYLLSEDEADNISSALSLQEDVHLKALKNNPTFFVHARRDAYNEVYAHYSQYATNIGETPKMKIKIIDSAYLSVQALKQSEDTLPVKCVKVNENGTVDTPFTAMLVGFGGTGQESFKFLYEFSTFIDSNKKRIPFKCYAFDEKMDKIEGLVKAKMTAITDKELCLIKTHVDSEEYWGWVKIIINKLNYVVVALNNDVLGMSTAVNLFKYALMMRDKNLPMLKIMLRCYNRSNEKRMLEVEKRLNSSASGLNVEIKLFGTTDKLFTFNNVVANSVFHEAKVFHYIYENSLLPIEKRWKLSVDKQWENSFVKQIDDGSDVIDATMKKRNISRYHAIYEINRQISQNYSNSLHCQTKMILMGFDKISTSEHLKLYYDYVRTRVPLAVRYECDEDTAELLYNIAMVEHERWIASHKLMGFTYNGETDYVKKHHKYMCAFEELDEITQSYDCNVVDTTIKLSYLKTLGKNFYN